MTNTNKFTIEQRFAIMRFHKQRADYYTYLASLFRNSETKPIEIFRTDAQRYGAAPRGVLSALWDERFESGGADLAATWEGTLPDAELMILRLTADGGSQSLAIALESMARVARVSDQVKSEAVGTLATAAVALMLALLSLALLPILAVAQYKESLDVPVRYWFAVAHSLLDWSQWVSANGISCAVVLIGLVAWTAWSVRAFVAPVRCFLDEHVALYRIARDVEGMRFLIVMAELTRPRGNNMSTLLASLEALRANSANPWLSWRLDDVLTRMNASGGVTLDYLDNGLMPKEVFWYLRDLEESHGNASTAFALTADYIQRLQLPRFVKSLARVRWAVLICAVLIIVGTNVWVMRSSMSMKAAAMNFYSSR